MRHREVLPPCVLAHLGLTGTGVGLRPQRLAFFCSQVEPSHPVMGETSGTWGQSFVFASLNVAITAHILLCVSSRNAFLRTLWKNPISMGNKLTRHIHPKSIVYLRTHSWCCAFYGFG